MSINGMNVCEDSEMADCDGEKVVTMMDVLKEQEDFEEDANAVLGASDDKNCTYSKGYVKRQAIYACMTCCTDPSKWAGVCLACSLTCHENHELIELYTKRNFRCDCGNPKFNSHLCQFTPNKPDLNIENMYNQNFSGVYCICHRPYPDPESSTQADMIQCIICEDWLHSHHLDTIVPSNEQYSEMICKACMDKNEFLHDYSDLAVNKEGIEVDILNISSEQSTVVNFSVNASKMTRNENMADSNFEDIVNNDAVVEETSANVIKKIEQSITLESAEKGNSIEEEQSNPDSEKNEVGDSTRKNLTLNKENTCELRNDKNDETKQKFDTQLEETKASAEVTEKMNNNIVKEQSSLIKGEATTIVKKETTDNGSKEQVEEDLLLTDSMDTDFDQKDNISYSTPNTVEFSSDTFIDEQAVVSDSMKISESISGNQIKKIEVKDDLNSSKTNEIITEESLSEVSAEESKNVAIIKKSNSVTTAEETEGVPTAGKLNKEVTVGLSENVVSTKESQNVITTDQSEYITPMKETENAHYTAQVKNVPHLECGIAKNAANTNYPEDILSADQTNNALTSEHSESNTNIKASDNISNDSSENLPTIKQSVNVVTGEQLGQHDKVDNEERDISANENNSLKKICSTDIVIDDNTIADTAEDEKQIDVTEINSNKDNEADKKIEIDILKRKLSSNGDIANVEIKKPKLEETKCVRPKGGNKVHHGATFWPSSFRHRLCTCNECISMYKDLSVLFLIDPDDTVTAYETLGKEKTDGKPVSQYEKGMAALSSLGRVQQINALTEYTKLRDKLLDFLKTFKDKKVIVKEEDIKAFFAGMKPTREPDGVYFCR